MLLVGFSISPALHNHLCTWMRSVPIVGTNGEQEECTLSEFLASEDARGCGRRELEKTKGIFTLYHFG